MSEELKYIEGKAERFELTIYNDHDQTYTCLGISEERADEISNIVIKSYNEEKLFSNTLQRIVSQMNHINELVFASMLCSRVHDKTRESKMDSQLESKMKTLKLLAELIKSQNK
jgi:hypothetical protein